MKSWAIWTARTVLVTTAFAAGGGVAGAALASTPGGSDTGNVSVLDGNQVYVPVSVPVDVCGNAVAILGFATAGCQGGATVASGLSAAGASHGARGTRTANISVVHGTVVRVPVAVPANACGNAVAVLGASSAGCAGGAAVGQRAVAGQHSAIGGAVKRLSANQLAGLGALPGVANLPALGGLTGTPLLKGLTGGGALLPASTLSAYQTEPGGMSDGSYATLGIGALLAGAAVIKLAGGRPRPRSARIRGVAA